MSKKRPNYARIASLIPEEVQVRNKVSYKIGFTNGLGGGKYHGQTWPQQKVIFLDMHMSDRVKVHTYFHELLHAISDEYGVGLTEKQILLMEKSFHYLLKPGNLFRSIEERGDNDD